MGGDHAYEDLRLGSRSFISPWERADEPSPAQKVQQVQGLRVITRSTRKLRADLHGGAAPAIDQTVRVIFHGWEGLFRQTAGFRDGLWLDANGSPLTDGAHVTERFRRVNYGKMEIEITVDDLKAYSAPWTVKLNHLIALDTDLIDYICNENEKDTRHLVGK